MRRSKTNSRINLAAMVVMLPWDIYYPDGNAPREYPFLGRGPMQPNTKFKLIVNRLNMHDKFARLCSRNTDGNEA